jgi:CheY-like chemotaxis protein
METILLIDDDREIRRGLRFALQELGYFVVETEGSEAAIQCTSDFSLKIDLLLTDAECAKESGLELAAWIQQIQPDMGVLCMTTLSGAACRGPRLAFERLVFHREAISVYLSCTESSRSAGRTFLMLDTSSMN